MECWNISHILIIIIVISFFGMVMGLVLLYSLMLNDGRSLSGLIWGSTLSRAEFIKTLSKVIICLGVHANIYSNWIVLIFQVAVFILSYLVLH